MPIHEYICDDCRHAFEALTRSSVTPRCPSCDGDRLARQLSTFAVAGGGTSSPAPAPAGCGTCGDPRGPGSCALPEA